jgi:hypothetical protein
MFLNRKTSDGNLIEFRKDNTVVGSIGTSNGDLYIGTGDTGLRFHDGDNSIYSVNATTGAKINGAIDLGEPAGRFKDLYLSGGVYLGGTGSANKLDDYEEGTFTPNLPNVTIGNGTISGVYTKIGSLVMVQIIFIMGSTTTMGGSFLLDNLPFTATATLVNHYGLTGNLLDSGVDNYMAYGRVNDGTTRGFVYYPQSGSSGSPNASRAVNTTAPFTWGTNDKIECGFMYYTDA